MGLVLLLLGGAAFAQTAPVAVNDAPPAINEGGTINGTFSVLGNDTDAENNPLTAVLISSPANARSRWPTTQRH